MQVNAIIYFEHGQYYKIFSVCCSVELLYNSFHFGIKSSEKQT